MKLSELVKTAQDQIERGGDADVFATDSTGKVEIPLEGVMAVYKGSELVRYLVCDSKTPFPKD